MSGLDLRTALYLVLPEFRFIRIQEGEAGLERVLAPEQLAPEALLAHLRPMGFTEPGDDAGVSALAVRPPFLVKALPGTRRVRVVIPMDDEMPTRILQTQSPLGSEAMAAFLPPAAPGTHDTFVMEVTYEASETRSAFLVRQLVGGHLATGWNLVAHEGWSASALDAGTELPERVSLTLRNQQLGGVLDLQRTGIRVDLRYRQPLRRR